MKTILFQGDSITDVSRERGDGYEIANFGFGYPNLIKAVLSYECPDEYKFYNRGISGNRIIDIYARIKEDIINLKPDVMSILDGVNDVWHEIENQNGIDAEKYYSIYSMLIKEIKEALPDIKIMILEPFVLHGEATNEHYDEFRAEVLKRAEKAKKIAEEYNLPFIALQEKLDKFYQTAPEGYWLWDGVHPTQAGHELIKREWLNTFKNL